MNTDTSKENALGAENTTDGTENGAPEGGVESVQLEELKAKLQDSEKKYLYLYSDFENFRRRNERERMDFLKFGHEGFLRDLLQVVDNFERALEHAKKQESEKGSALSQVVQGIEMIHFQMMDALRNQGVVPVNANGAKFDPAIHEAVGDEDSEAEAGTVLQVAQKGYTLHGRLLRAARVIVAKKKS